LTSNCTYPQAFTLGVCSTCEDVTNSSKTVCNNGDGISISNQCSITTPGGVSLFAAAGSGESATSWGTMVDANSSFGTSLEINSRLITWAIVGGNRSVEGNTDSKLPITECQLQLYERIYSDFNVTNGEANVPSVKNVNLVRDATLDSLDVIGFMTASNTGNRTYQIGTSNFQLMANTLAELLTTVLYSAVGDSIPSGINGIPAPPSGLINIANTLYLAQDIGA
jgi:hypothetical protein